jgi:hypothetical protein
MSQDAYAPCPCGSGKKLKFCCGDILPELQRAQKLVDNQPDVAEKILRELHEQHPDKDSVVSLLAELLQRAGRLAEVRELLIGHLRRFPDHPHALLGLAELCLIEDGFEASRRLVHRAFQLCSRENPNAVALLAQRIARELMGSGCHLAVREHLAMSVRHAQGELRKQALMMLASFEGSPEIVYPFRGSNPLVTVEGAVATQEQDQRARKLCLLGCFEPAAIIYSRLTEAEPDNGAIWHNLGLCCAWDARHADAIPALRKAATLIDDPDLAAESEALAQLLEAELSDDTYAQVTLQLQLKSASQALSSLDEDRSLQRIRPTEEDEREFAGINVAARYDVLSRPLTDEEDAADLPELIGEIMVVDADDDGDGPFVEISTSSDSLQEIIVRLRSILGDQITTGSDEEEVFQRQEFPAENMLFDRPLFKPPALSEKEFRAAQRRRLQNLVSSWLDQPHRALNNKTPNEASDDASLAIPLRAAVLNLQAVALRCGESVSVTDVLQQLELPAATAVSLPENAQPSAIPGYRYFRVGLNQLSDTQLADFANRTTMLAFAETAKKCLDAMLERPEALKKFGERRAALARATIAREEGDYASAFECLAMARNCVAGEPDAFRHLLEIDVRELSVRLDDPNDPGLIDLLHKFRDKYIRKIPEIAEIVRQQLEDSGCENLIPELEGEASVSSLVLPGDDSAGAGESSGKLWLPGQG